MAVDVRDYFKKVLLMVASCKTSIGEVSLHTSFDNENRFAFYMCVKVLDHYITCNFRPNMSESDCENNLKDAKTLLMGSKPLLKKPISKQFVRLMPYIIRYFDKVERMSITVNGDKNTIDFSVQEFTKGYCQWHYANMRAVEDKGKTDKTLYDMGKYLKPIKRDEGRNL